MWQDPIILEVRKIREKYAAGFKQNTEALYKDICKRQDKPGKLLVELSPRKPALKKKAA